jgi:hypothetical protein
VVGHPNLEVHGEPLLDHLPVPLEAQDEVVAARTELDLQVAVSGSCQEELHDLVLPESCRRTRRSRRQGIAVKRGVDPDLPPLLARDDLHGHGLASQGRGSVPESVDS